MSPTSGKIVGEVNAPHHWFFILAQLHYFLLLGRVGLIAEWCRRVVPAPALPSAASFSGGLVSRNWKRGFGVKLNASWKRVNYDLHSSIRFWTLIIVSHLVCLQHQLRMAKAGGIVRQPFLLGGLASNSHEVQVTPPAKRSRSSFL